MQRGVDELSADDHLMTPESRALANSGVRSLDQLPAATLLPRARPAEIGAAGREHSNTAPL